MPTRPGGRFDSDEFCVVLSEVCEAYGGWPSQRMGWDRPDDMVLALAFDSSVLQRARKWQADRMEEVRTGEKSELDYQAARSDARERIISQLPADSPFRKQLEDSRGR